LSDSRPTVSGFRPLRIAVLVSGRGSNLQALLDAIASGRLHAQIVGVFSDKANAPALQRARDVGAHAESLAPRDFPNRLAFDLAFFERVEATQPDLIVCAGYMRLISDAAIAPRLGRVINIHPSLLPAFKGLRTHAQALAAHAPEHGASVHFVTPDLDGGPVIAQAGVPVLADDDTQALATRVLAREHPLLVATVGLLATGRVALDGDTVVLDGHPLAAPLQLTANNAFA
jgi:phosphoribosylglycinamide formyltransferase 1